MKAKFATALLLLLAGACGGSGGSGGQALAPGVGQSPGATPTPTPTVPAGPRIRFDWTGKAVAPPGEAAIGAYRLDTLFTASLLGLPAIASNFDRAAQVQVSQSPVVSDGTNIGAFRMICQAAQVNYDDPIVYPGVVNGSPHLHQWFGNTEANALSTYASLRTSGHSTCMGPLNRSAYWIPAMIRNDGMVIRPDYLSVYYKRYPKSAPECHSTARECISLPHGLRYVFGFDMRRMHQSQPENMIFHWKCVTPQNTQIGDITTRIGDLR